ASNVAFTLAFVSAFRQQRGTWHVNPDEPQIVLPRETIVRNLPWIADSLAARLYPDDVFDLLLPNCPAEASRLVPYIAWDWQGHRGKIAAVYSLHFLAKLQTLDWNKALRSSSELPSRLIQPVLEHTNFNYEESVLRTAEEEQGKHRSPAEIFATSSIEDYARL